MNFICIIPARFASTRLPGKPLVDISGKTMIRRVYEQAYKVFNHVLVATDDKRIIDEVEGFGGFAVMTFESHQSGTDRCLEALDKFEEITGKKFDVVVNIQGDEPFIRTEPLENLKLCFDERNVQIATLVKEIDSQEDYLNPNKPKVIFNTSNEAIYFSRSPIPYIRDISFNDALKIAKFYKHIGVYSYRAEILRKITNLPFGNFETLEKLEQNRWIENGYKIKISVTEYESLSVDTYEDLELIRKFVK